MTTEHTDFIFAIRPDTLPIVRLIVVVVTLVALFYVLRRRRARNRPEID